MNDALALRAGEAARLLRISTRFLAQLTREGKIPHKRVGRAVLYPVEELREWLRRCPGPDGSEATLDGSIATLDGSIATLDGAATRPKEAAR